MSIVMTQQDTLKLYSEIGEHSGKEVKQFMIHQWALDLETQGKITVRELDSLTIHRAAICEMLADEDAHEETEAKHLADADKSMSDYWERLDS